MRINNPAGTSRTPGCRLFLAARRGHARKRTEHPGSGKEGADVAVYSIQAHETNTGGQEFDAALASLGPAAEIRLYPVVLGTPTENRKAPEQGIAHLATGADATRGGRRTGGKTRGHSRTRCSQRNPCGSNWAKSRSRVTQVHPCDIARAACCASATNLPVAEAARQRRTTSPKCGSEGIAVRQRGCEVNCSINARATGRGVGSS